MSKATERLNEEHHTALRTVDDIAVIYQMDKADDKEESKEYLDDYVE